jgi:hypothetical protein
MFLRLVVSAASFVTLITVCGAQAMACESHINGHQNSAATQSEVQSAR